MTRGYITAALNSRGVDYVRMAYGLALSLRLTQSAVSGLTVLVARERDVPRPWRSAFDRIVELPHGDDSTPGGWRVQNYHQLHDASPYDETVTLDADMLFFDDVSPWWDVMSERDVVAATHVLDYRGRVVEKSPYRDGLHALGLPDVHTGFFYFKKGEKAVRLFETMRALTRDWQPSMKRLFGLDDAPYAGDFAFCAALRVLGLEREIVARGGVPIFVHMKTGIQGIRRATGRDWRRWLKHRFSPDLGLYIGGRRIRAPLHYHVRDFLDDALLSAYEARVGR